MGKTKKDYKKVLISFAIIVLVIVIMTGGAVADRLFGFRPLDLILPRSGGVLRIDRQILKEESVVIDVAETASPSVVTVSVKTPKRSILELSPFGGFQRRTTGGEDVDIGTGFVVSSEGLIITNKHVVSDTDADYKVIDKDGKEYEVKEINRDPSNDIAILKISANGLMPVELGDSSILKVGQFVIAIGTALGKLSHTVTTGVISGLGRGITAGSVFEGYIEQLDNVIQTDAAINPGNSGGPLLNSAGQVIGINVAIAQGAENIGFAIPVNVVKDSLETFNRTGKFAPKPYLGVQYQMIGKTTAILNNVPQGAFVVDVIENSPAERAGIQEEDIITKFDGKVLAEVDGGLAEVISSKEPGDKISLEVWRDEETHTLSATLSEFTE